MASGDPDALIVPWVVCVIDTTRPRITTVVAWSRASPARRRMVQLDQRHIEVEHRRIGRPCHPRGAADRVVPVGQAGNIDYLNVAAAQRQESGFFGTLELHDHGGTRGKVDPHDRRFGASHLVWAKALVQQGRFSEALPHARLADQLLAQSGFSVGANALKSEAHQVLSEIQTALARPPAGAQARQ